MHPSALTAVDLPSSYGRYVLQSILGEGGMARVFLAELQGPAGFKKTVAVKVIKEGPISDGPSTQLFLQEARLGGLLRHPNLVDVYELGEESQSWFLAMEWVQGLNLDELIQQRGPLPPRVLLTVGMGICKGLSSAHDLKVGGQRAGLIHRDLKPSNILLGWDGQVKIADFGMAHVALKFRDTAKEQLSGGTPGYMSPEQWCNSSIDHRSDIFALGCVLYEMATAKFLFDAPWAEDMKASASEVCKRLQHAEEHRLLEKHLPGLTNIVVTCLRAYPYQRYASAAQARGALQDLMSSAPHKPSLDDWLTTAHGRQTGSKPTLPIAQTAAHSGSEARPSTQHNLGLEPNSFVGREPDLAALADRLSNHRLVTVTGPPGTGKTRFATHFSRAWLSDGQCESVWLCDLSQTKSTWDILGVIASALDTPLTDSQSNASKATESLGHAIAGRGKTLLLLDNAEQVTHQLGEIIALWWTCAPAARFVVTSRIPLSLDMEHQQPLAPLPLPGPEASLPTLQKNECVALFVARAQAVRPSFVLDESNRDDIATMIRKLDGLPLALELAAARLKIWSPKILRARLSDRFQMLARPQRTTLRRQSTLRGALDWSWDLLMPWEQAALAQCSVFRGDFDWPAVEAIVDLKDWPEAPWSVDAVATLVEHSLVMVDSGLGNPKVSLLSIITEYGREKLTKMDKEMVEALYRRHARYFAQFGTQEQLNALAKHNGPAQLRWLHENLENLVTATQHAIHYGWPEEAMNACQACNAVWAARGPVTAGVALTEQVLGFHYPSGQDFRLHMQRTHFNLRLQNFTLCEDQYAKALEMARDIPFPEGEAQALRWLGRIKMLTHQFEEAERLIDAALTISRTHGIGKEVARSLCVRAMMRERQGQTHRALEEMQEGLNLFESLGDRQNQGVSNHIIARMKWALGDFDEAKSVYERADEISREVGDQITQNRVACDLGRVCDVLGKPEQARAHYVRSLALARRAGDRRQECSTLEFLGIHHVQQGQFHIGRDYFGDALEMSQKIQQPALEASIVGNMGLSYFLEKKESEAIGLCEDAIRLCEGLEQTSAEASVYKLYGEILLSADRIDDAERAFRVSLPFYARTETGVAYRQICGSLAVVAAKQGQFSTSQTHLKNCLLDKEPASRDLVHFELVCKRGLVQVYSGELDEARESLNEAKAVLQPLHLPPVCTARFNLTSLQDAIRRGSDGLKPMPRTE